jgi:hypothetical protein
MGTGGDLWSEPTVTYQGREQMPWPGIDKWNGNTLLQIPNMELYDPEAGRSADRGDGEIYENAELRAATTAAPSAGFRTISP